MLRAVSNEAALFMVSEVEWITEYKTGALRTPALCLF